MRREQEATMRNRILIAVVGMVVGVGLMAAEASAFSASYDQRATQGRNVTDAKVSLKDELFRMETTIQGQTAVIIHNREGTFTVIPSEGMAMKIAALHPGQGPLVALASGVGPRFLSPLSK